MYISETCLGFTENMTLKRKVKKEKNEVNLL